MRILVGVLGGLLVALMLFEIFLAFLLPRRVKRDPLLARRVAMYAFAPWRALARRLPESMGDTLLGMYGPFGLLLDLGLWVAMLMLGYACLQWAGGSHLRAGSAVSFGDDVYFAAATLVSSGTAGLASHSTFARVVQVLDAATGLAVLTIVIGYLPSLYQAFSRRETTVSQLDARAGVAAVGGAPGRPRDRTRRLAGAERLSARLGGVVGRADGDPPVLPDPCLLPLPARQPELAFGAGPQSSTRAPSPSARRRRGRSRRRGSPSRSAATRSQTCAYTFRAKPHARRGSIACRAADFDALDPPRCARRRRAVRHAGGDRGGGFRALPPPNRAV